MAKKRNLVFIGSSTGGPKALTKLFKDMPKLNASIIIVQHMPKFINGSVIENLSRETAMEIKLASDGEIIKNGTAYFAPSEVHLELEDNKKIKLRGDKKVNHVCPSVDITMQSVQASSIINIVGVILTGMGQDGAKGISHIKKVGGLTYAQSEETCAVYGMPKAAFETGNVDTVLSPEGIKDKLVTMLGVAS